MTPPKKTVAFVIHYPYQWYIYRPIWRHIDWVTCEVIVDLHPFPMPLPATVREDVERLLIEEGVSYRVLPFADYFNTKKLTEFFAGVEVLVSCWERGCMSVAETAHIKKVNTTYGIAKELTLVRPSRSLCDLILAYGPRDQAYFSLLTKSVAVGNPRFDDFYNQTQKIPAECQSLPREKPVLLYAPGHGDLGSLATLYEVFRDEVTKHYTVVLKPHYFTLRDEAPLISQYAELPNLTVVNDATDLIGVMAVADMVLTDTSSLIFDALQARKPLVVTDFVSAEYLDGRHKVLRSLPRGFSGASTYGDSLEQVCKREGKLRTIVSPQELLPTLRASHEWYAELRPVQEELVRELFAYTDGTSGQRAAGEIQTLYSAPRNHRPGILAHAYLAYKNRFSQLFLSAQPTKAEGVLSQVVVIDDERASVEEREATVASAQGMAERVVFLSVSGAGWGEVPGVRNFNEVREWLTKDQNVLFVGVGVVLPDFQSYMLPDAVNKICLFGGGAMKHPMNSIKQTVLGIRSVGGVSLSEAAFIISKPNQFCTDIQAVVMSAQLFCDYNRLGTLSDFGHFPLAMYRQYGPVATFRYYPFLLDQIRADDVYVEQQMYRYGLFARALGLQVWHCVDLKTLRLLYWFFKNRAALRLAVIKMNAMLWER